MSAITEKLRTLHKIATGATADFTVQSQPDGPIETDRGFEIRVKLRTKKDVQVKN